jgi:hypothetical protein
MTQDPNVQIREVVLSDGSIVYDFALNTGILHAASMDDACTLADKIMKAIAEHTLDDGVTYDYSRVE